VATGVTARVGKFELADGGTLFLDEVGDMSTPLQAKLLRVLQGRAFERVGGSRTIEVDVRVIAATNRDLEKAMAEDKFRQDLYYRLNVMTIALPPLRERREDLPALVSHFLQHFNQEFGRQVAGVSPDVMALFRRYPWPGNVRELVNLMERAVILCPTETINVTDLPVAFQTFAQENPEPPAPAAEEPGGGGPGDRPQDLWRLRKLKRDEATGELEHKLIMDALARNKGNIAKTARELDVSRAQLYRLMDRHGLRG
jgi:two-component system nitrogen regulation response regulator NtrX